MLHWPTPLAALVRLFDIGPFSVSMRSQMLGEANEARWRRDPLSHPAIRAMSPREIADLPFDPRAILAE